MKKELTTIQLKRRWKALDYTLRISKYLLPCVPASIITAINWEEWFVNCGASLPFGFATLLISVIVTILAIYKGDEVVNAKVSKLFYLAVVLAVWAIAFMFLANIMQQIGQMILWTAVGVVVGATGDQVEKSYVSKVVTEYEQLIHDNCLSKEDKKKKERAEKAKAEAEAKQATE